MRPVAVPAFVTNLFKLSNEEKIALVQRQYKQLLRGTPLVTVVIPAYNEEQTILNVLVSITANITQFSTQVIVVNNNSTDRTEELVKATGVTCLNETKKGVRFARTAGLMAAEGKYVMNADADSVYAPKWIEKLIAPLEANSGIALCYGKFAFLPGSGRGRLMYFFYETMADVLRWYKGKFKEEAVNVYGCSSAFRKEQCLAVDGYDHPPGATEDGYLALKLRNKGFGKLNFVPDSDIIVWTVDRHLQQDGGLLKALMIRVKQVFFGYDPKHFHQK